eukprot:3105975-Heterocapsa_arctica.AAC.1
MTPTNTAQGRAAFPPGSNLRGLRPSVRPEPALGNPPSICPGRNLQRTGSSSPEGQGEARTSN